MSKITIRCGWCDKWLGEKDGQGVEGVSHGICDDCLTKNFPHVADLIRTNLEVPSIEDIYTSPGKKEGVSYGDQKEVA